MGRVRVVRLGAFFALTTLFVACGLDVVGEDPVGTNAPDAAPDVVGSMPGDSAGDGTADATGDAFLAPEDAGVDAAPDAGTDADADADADAGPGPVDAGCPPLAKAPAGTTARTAVIARAANADGTATTHVFRECATFVLDGTTAAFTQGVPQATATVYLEWDPGGLWVRFDVADAQIVGTDPMPFLNDSIEVYLSSDPARVQDYGVHDHQFIVDHRGVGLHATNGTQGGYNEGVAKPISGGYRVTMRLDATLFGGGFASGKTLFVDALLSDGTNQDNFYIWSEEPHPAPATKYPASDPRLFFSRRPRMTARPKRIVAVLVAVVAVAGGAGAWWLTQRRAVLGNATVEPGPLVVGQIAPAVGARSPGCAENAAGAEGRAFSVGARRFYVWGPKSEPLPPSGTARPIVLAFHGWGSNGRQFQQWFEMEKRVGDAAYVVYPDSDGPNWDYTGDNDIRFVIAIVEQLGATYCVDATRVLAVGFSYGGRFVNHLGCRAPALVRGIVVAGSRWDANETTCVAPIPVLVTHRTRDSTMPIAGGREAAERWAKLERCSGTQPISNGCLAWTGCEAGAVTFCEDRHYDPEWPRSWNHTLRESYQLLAWRWFEQLR